jgi:hypothetical protein
MSTSCQIVVYTQSLGVTERCRLSWLTNSALVYEGGGGGLQGHSQRVQLCTWCPNKLRDLTSYLALHSTD